MLDQLLDEDLYPQCPKCDAELIKEGDKWLGCEKCSQEDCDYIKEWDYLP